MKIYAPTYHWNGSLLTRSRTDYIVLHHAQARTCTAQDIHRWHIQNGWSGIGYHFLVCKDGTVWSGRPIETVGAHVQGFNSNSVGVCFEGAYHTLDRTMPPAQLEAGKELIALLREKYPGAHMRAHRDLTATDCPGQYFPYEELISGKEDNLTSKEYEELNRRLTAAEHPMIYNYVDVNMPLWARETVQKLVRKGALRGNEKGELGLTDDLLRVLVIHDRLGLYGE